MNIGRVHGSSAPIAITDTTTTTAPTAYAAPDLQCSRPSPSSAQPSPLTRNQVTSPTATTGTVTTPAHGVVKCASKFAHANTTTTTATSTWMRNWCSAESWASSGCGSTAADS